MVYAAEGSFNDAGVGAAATVTHGFASKDRAEQTRAHLDQQRREPYAVAAERCGSPTAAMRCAPRAVPVLGLGAGRLGTPRQPPASAGRAQALRLRDPVPARSAGPAGSPGDHPGARDRPPRPAAGNEARAGQARRAVADLRAGGGTGHPAAGRPGLARAGGGRQPRHRPLRHLRPRPYPAGVLLAALPHVGAGRHRHGARVPGRPRPGRLPGHAGGGGAHRGGRRLRRAAAHHHAAANRQLGGGRRRLLRVRAVRARLRGRRGARRLVPAHVRGAVSLHFDGSTQVFCAATDRIRRLLQRNEPGAEVLAPAAWAQRFYQEEAR